MLSVTVQAIQPQAGPAGRPNQAITTRFGKPAPMTSAATAAFASRRDFTQAFQDACRKALTSMAAKTARLTGRELPAPLLKPCFVAMRNSPADATAARFETGAPGGKARSSLEAGCKGLSADTI